MFKSLSPGTIGVKANLTEGLAYAKGSGFQGLDLSIGEAAKLVAEKDADFVKGLFNEAGLEMGSWGLGITWNRSEEEFQEGLKALPEMAAAGAAIGACRVSQWVPCASEDRAFRENFKWHIERFRPIGEILKDHGCNLGLEFIGPQKSRVDRKYGFIYTLSGMLALCEAIGTGNIGLLLDCWHWYTSLGTLSDLRQLAVDDVVHVHVNDAPAGLDFTEQVDNVRALPSETGVIDLPGFLSELKNLGYQGPVSPEPFSQKVRELPAEVAIRETHEGLDKAWKAAGLT